MFFSISRFSFFFLLILLVIEIRHLQNDNNDVIMVGAWLIYIYI